MALIKESTIIYPLIKVTSSQYWSSQRRGSYTQPLTTQIISNPTCHTQTVKTRCPHRSSLPQPESSNQGGLPNYSTLILSYHTCISFCLSLRWSDPKSKLRVYEWGTDFSLHFGRGAIKLRVKHHQMVENPSAEKWIGVESKDASARFLK